MSCPGIGEVEKRPAAGSQPSSRRAVCEQHKYGSVRAALGDWGGYSPLFIAVICSYDFY